MSIKKLTFHLCLAMPLMSFVFTPNIVSAADGTVEIDLLEEFGLEVFETDPKKQAEFEAQKEKERNDALPAHISPETLDADAQLDAIDLEAPKAPIWDPVEKEASLTGYDSKECCLRAIRTTRYEVEAQCLSSGREIWHIESIPVKEATSESIKTHKLCEIYHNDNAKQQIEDTLASEEDQGVDNMEPELFECRARSVAKCFDPTLEENALFRSK
ncbi:MAG: hypothetical protein VX185_03295 [Pseudomonadota bacterium]|nr:hypothetical protein [Pseudomonadota bacterium]